MMQNVNSVLVSNNDLKTSYVSAAAADLHILEDDSQIPTGELFLVDQNGKLINHATVTSATSNPITAAKAIKVGLKTAETTTYTDTTGTEITIPVVKYSPLIQKGKVTKATFTEYVAPIEDKIKFDFAGVTVKAGNRYVVRFIYRDIYEHPGQFTKTYEVIATTDILADLVVALKNRINKDMGRRITITSDSAYATDFIATAKAKTDNEGKESINPYTQVSMTAVAYYTNPGATGFASKIKYPIASLDITKTQGTCPKGYWKQVRDAEQAALAYKGITYRTSWPYSLLKPAIVADSAITYDSYIIEFENSYLTPDNQRNSTARQTVELYFKDTAGDATKSIVTWLNTFTA